MKHSFVDILQQQAETQSEQETSNQNQIDFKHHELTVVGLTLSETLQAQEPTIDFLSTDHFKDELLGAIYQHCLSEHGNTGKSSRLSIVQGLLAHLNDADNFISFLLQQAFGTPKELIKSLAYELDEYKKYNQIKETLQRQLDEMQAYKPLSEFAKQLDNMTLEFSKLAYNQVEKKIFTHDEALDSFINEFYTAENTSISTGLIDLDKMLGGGFIDGDLIVLAGRPGMGKTAFMIEMLANITENNKNGLLFSLEMSNRQNMARFISRDMHKHKGDNQATYKKILNAMSFKQKQPLFDEYFEIAKKYKKNILHNYTEGLTISQIVNFSLRHSQNLQRQGKRLDFIAVDYLQIIGMSNDFRVSITEITATLKRLAKRLSCPVLVLSQLNRDCEKEAKIENKRPQTHHLKESGSIEQDADRILFAFRPTVYEKEKTTKEWPENYMEIIVAKNRNGETGIVKIRADMATNHFQSVDDPSNFGKLNTFNELKEV